MRHAIYVIVHGEFKPTVLIRQDIQAAIEKADSIALAQANGNRDYLTTTMPNDNSSLVYIVNYNVPGYGDNHGNVYVYQKFIRLEKLMVLE